LAARDSQTSFRIHGRGGAATAVALSAATLALSLGATPAHAVVAKIGGRGYGVTPIAGVNPASIPGALRAPGSSALSGATAPRNFDGPPAGGGPLTYNGGPVMHSSTTHVIYWDPSKEFKTTTKEIIGNFFTDVAHDSGLASNVFGVAGQYTDGTGNAAYGSTFGGSLADEDLYPSTGNCTVPNEVDKGPPYTKCLFDSQLQSELSTYISTHGLPTGPTQLYLLLLPHKVVTCLEATVCSNNVFCAYHSYITPGTTSEIIYADIPFSLLDTEFAKGCQSDGNSGIPQQPNPDPEGGLNSETRFADVALKYTSHEYIEAVTDPLVNFETGWADENGLEIGDKCNGVSPDLAKDGIGYDANAFLPTLGGSAGSDSLFNQSINAGTFYLQSEWDNAAGACLMRPVALSGAAITASPASGIVGSPVSFSASASDPYGALGFTWSFGDGGTGTGSSPSHTYAAPGVYTVTMAPRDGLTGSTAPPVSQTVVVNDLPTGSFTMSPNPAIASVPAGFNGSASSDRDGSIVSYVWSFGDGGAAGSGVTPSHTYGAPGTYAVTLTVTDSGGQTATVTQFVTVGAAPNSNFTTLRITVNAKTGAITFTESVRDPGTFSWLLTFQNGKFGVFASSNAKCKSGFVRLNGRCRPSKIVFAKGRKIVTAPGILSFTIKPSASALNALTNALSQQKGVPVAIGLTFQSSRGGSPVSHARSLTVRLKKK
jgi:PKD repeat protein